MVKALLRGGWRFFWRGGWLVLLGLWLLAQAARVVAADGAQNFTRSSRPPGGGPRAPLELRGEPRPRPDVTDGLYQIFLPLVANRPVALRRGPYLQMVSPYSAMLIWDTNLPTPGEVLYGPGAYTASLLDNISATRHIVRLNGLDAYTSHHYRLRSGLAPLGEDYAFRTAAGPGQTSFSFAVLGDTQQADVHRRVVERALSWQPDFVLHTGDLVDDGRLDTEWDNFFQIEQPLLARAPLWPAIGNHELDNRRYYDNFYLPGNERWYTFEYGNARFISLELDGRWDDIVPGPQLSWLTQTLTANTQPWVFVYFHVPPYAAEIPPLDSSRKVQDYLASYLQQYKVNMVFSGHRHYYARSEVGGVTYLVNGGGGGAPYPIQWGNPWLRYARSAYFAVRVTVTGKTLTSVAVTPEGEEFDRFTLTTK